MRSCAAVVGRRNAKNRDIALRWTAAGASKWDKCTLHMRLSMSCLACPLVGEL
jgi:hypothetical protein